MIGDDDERAADFLRVVPGVKDRFLVVAFGVVEQSSADLGDGAAGEQAAPRQAGTGEQGRHHRPRARPFEMAHRGAVGIRDEKFSVLSRGRPGERQADLPRLAYGSAPARRMRSELPEPSTTQPRAANAERSVATSPA